jgi:hypothetical protein
LVGGNIQQHHPSLDVALAQVAGPAAAKMLWDARLRLVHVASIKFQPPWPAAALTRAVTQMYSPCVADDLLRQRAPGLAPHTRTIKHPALVPAGGPWEEVVHHIRSVPPGQLSIHLKKLRSYLLAADADGLTVDCLGKYQPLLRKPA